MIHLPLGWFEKYSKRFDVENMDDMNKSIIYMIEEAPQTVCFEKLIIKTTVIDTYPYKGQIEFTIKDQDEKSIRHYDTHTSLDSVFCAYRDIRAALDGILLYNKAKMNLIHTNSFLDSLIKIAETFEGSRIVNSLYLPLNDDFYFLIAEGEIACKFRKDKNWNDTVFRFWSKKNGEHLYKIKENSDISKPYLVITDRKTFELFFNQIVTICFPLM